MSLPAAEQQMETIYGKNFAFPQWDRLSGAITAIEDEDDMEKKLSIRQELEGLIAAAQAALSTVSATSISSVVESPAASLPRLLEEDLENEDLTIEQHNLSNFIKSKRIAISKVQHQIFHLRCEVSFLSLSIHHLPSNIRMLAR